MYTIFSTFFTGDFNKGDNTINREWVKVGYNERKRERKKERADGDFK